MVGKFSRYLAFVLLNLFDNLSQLAVYNIAKGTPQD